MRYDPLIHKRRSIRLPGYDYTLPGSYFVTIVTHHRARIFGDIADGEMRLNDFGQIAMDCWRAIPAHFPKTSLDEFIIMPNHIHGIIVMDDAVGAGSPRPYGCTPPDTETAPLSPTLGRTIAFFKYQTAKRINDFCATPAAPVWQRNYYDHIIRNGAELSRIRKYIHNNPARWENDIENGLNPPRNRVG